MKVIKSFNKFFESNSNEINDLIQKIKDCGTYGWTEKLETSFDCITLEDTNLDSTEWIGAEYNGWFEELLELSKTNEELKPIIDKIYENRYDLWDHELENTFQCVILEDIDLTDEELEPIYYNGWFEDLLKLSSLNESISEDDMIKKMELIDKAWKDEIIEIKSEGGKILYGTSDQNTLCYNDSEGTFRQKSKFKKKILR